MATEPDATLLAGEDAAAFFVPPAAAAAASAAANAAAAGNTGGSTSASSAAAAPPAGEGELLGLRVWGQASSFDGLAAFRASLKSPGEQRGLLFLRRGRQAGITALCSIRRGADACLPCWRVAAVQTSRSWCQATTDPASRCGSLGSALEGAHNCSSAWGCTCTTGALCACLCPAFCHTRPPTHTGPRPGPGGGGSCRGGAAVLLTRAPRLPHTGGCARRRV